MAAGLGFEPKTGWAVFSVGIFAIVGYIVAYVLQVRVTWMRRTGSRPGASTPFFPLRPCLDQVEEDKIQAGLLPAKEGSLLINAPVPPPYPSA